MIYQFPSNFVGIVEPEFPEELFDDLLLQIDCSTSRYEERNGCHSDYGFSSKPWVHSAGGKHLLSKVIPAGIRDVMSKVQNSNVSVFTITDTWFAHYHEGGIHQPHTHAGSDLSVIYILRSDGENKTVFFQSGNILTEHVFHAKNAGVGSLLVFPSLLTHYVMAADTPRTIISANVKAG